MGNPTKGGSRSGYTTIDGGSMSGLFSIRTDDKKTVDGEREYAMVSQLNLFTQPSLNILRDLKQNMASAVESSGLSRDELCDRMNELAERYGVRLMKGNGYRLRPATMDKWLNPTDKERVIPVKALPVFCAAVGSKIPMTALVEPLGYRIIDEKEAKLLAWAEHYQSVKETRRKMKKLEAEL